MVYGYEESGLMFTTTLQQRASSVQGQRYLRSTSSENARSASHPAHPSRQNSGESERARILRNAETIAKREPPPPEQITQDAQNQGLGQPSRQIQLSDFELMKTLGTGK